MIKEKLGIQKINQNTKPYNVKIILKYNNKNSLKSLKLFLDKRKSIQKKQTIIVSKIIQNVKKNGDKAVLNYEKKFSKIKTKSNKIVFSLKKLINFKKKQI